MAWLNIKVNQPQIRGMANNKRQFLRPILLLTKPANRAPNNCPRLQILAIHDLSEIVKLLGNSGRRMALKPKIAPTLRPVNPPIIRDA